MSILKVTATHFILISVSFGEIPEHEINEFAGLFDFRAVDWNHLDHGNPDDYFADSRVMYDTLYETVLYIRSDNANDLINNEIKLQKLKIYNRFIKQLGLFRRANSGDLHKMSTMQRRSNQKRHTLRKVWSGNERNSTARSLNPVADNQWILLNELFDQKS